MVIARLVRPRGNRGELLAESLSSRPERFQSVRRAWLSKAGRCEEVELERAWWHDGRLILKFQGVDSISAAEMRRDADLLIPASQRIRLDEGEYFQSDLIGCRVVDQQGQVVGVVEAVSETGGVDLLVVKPPMGNPAEGQPEAIKPPGGKSEAGRRDGGKRRSGPATEEILIPFARAICRKVDLEGRRIEIDPPEGLLDL